MENKEIFDIIQKEGSPCYLFDVPALLNRVRAIREILGDKIALCYSIKANPFLVSEIYPYVDKLEVCSPGELDVCHNVKKQCSELDLGCIIYSGVNKTYQNVADAYAAGVGEYTAESLLHAQYLNELAQKEGVKLPVLLRLNAGSQFGMSKEDLISIVRERETKYRGLDLVGIHYFVGTQRKNKEYDKQKKELSMLKELFDEIEKDYGFRMRRLEYGPGLPVPLFEGDDFTDTLRPMKEMAETLKEVSSWAELTIEMGRFLATECGYYITKLMDQKTADGVNYAIFDGGINHVNYLGQLMGMKVPVIRHLTADGTEVTERDEDWKICGSLCTTNDDLVRSYAASRMEVGDFFIFENIGAYSITEGMYLFLSRTMPKVMVYRGGKSYAVCRDYLETSEINSPRF